ncbi:hypothetical protein R3P38DRAFT_1189876 [Favolaschia claudopus]|uniref:Uncharacterized protein n=1 Tax=Favolaschia claudopus TaxID=2862362 RepID=A0AAW0E2S3_9AGAR
MPVSSDPFERKILMSQFKEGMVNKSFGSYDETQRAWSELLMHLFHHESDKLSFHIAEERYFAPPTMESAGYWKRWKIEEYFPPATYEHCFVRLIIQYESEFKLSSPYLRAQVDYEVRAGMEKMHDEGGTLPVIHGIAAFGRYMAFYTKTGDEPILPLRPPLDPGADIAPQTLWNLDITTSEGAERLRGVIEAVFSGCERERVSREILEDPIQAVNT